MSSRIGFRVAAVIFLLFAAGHTAGFLSFHPSTPDGQATWKAMQSVHFGANANSEPKFSYGAFYIGFGLTITMFQLFEAWLSWVCAGMAARGLPESRLIGIGLAALQTVGFGMSLKYFGAAPAIFSLGLALLLTWSAIRVKTPRLD